MEKGNAPGGAEERNGTRSCVTTGERVRQSRAVDGQVGGRAAEDSSKSAGKELQLQENGGRGTSKCRLTVPSANVGCAVILCQALF